MLSWFTHLDRLLRGDVTRPELLREGRLEIDARGVAIIVLLLGMIYGVCMGSFSLLKVVSPNVVDASPPYMQLAATIVKVPALFYLTLLVTFPSLYVFNALVGSRLTLLNVLRLLIASLAVNLAVLASLGPIVLFFSVSTKSYAFVMLMNVVAFAVAGVLGLAFLLQTLNRLVAAGSPRELPDLNPAPSPDRDSALVSSDESNIAEDASALDMPVGQALSRHTRLVFGCWVVVFALVGAQMGWVLRPFIGTPAMPFEWFRERKSNFFEAVLNALGALLTGGG